MSSINRDIITQIFYKILTNYLDHKDVEFLTKFILAGKYEMNLVMEHFSNIEKIIIQSDGIKCFFKKFDTHEESCYIIIPFNSLLLKIVSSIIYPKLDEKILHNSLNGWYEYNEIRILTKFMRIGEKPCNIVLNYFYDSMNKIDVQAYGISVFLNCNLCKKEEGYWIRYDSPLLKALLPVISALMNKITFKYYCSEIISEFDFDKLFQKSKSNV